MKSIIHIGQHKTGTTSIQCFLQDRRRALTRSGLYVPRSVAGYEHPSHFILNVYALNADRFSLKKERVIRKKGEAYVRHLEPDLKQDIEDTFANAQDRDCDKVIWTNEGLYLLNTVTEYRRLFELFSEFSTEVEVVCCFRDVESYRRSYLKQLRKQDRPLSSNPDSYRYLEDDSWLLDYKRKRKLLSEVFDQCTFFRYDPDDNVKRFMSTIGEPAAGTEEYRLNRTAGA